MKETSDMSKTVKFNKGDKRDAVTGVRAGAHCLSHSDLSRRKKERKRHLGEMNKGDIN